MPTQSKARPEAPHAVNALRPRSIAAFPFSHSSDRLTDLRRATQEREQTIRFDSILASPPSLAALHLRTDRFLQQRSKPVLSLLFIEEVVELMGEQKTYHDTVHRSRHCVASQRKVREDDAVHLVAVTNPSLG